MLASKNGKLLTFDMSGRRQTAKLAVDCPLDGRVRPHLLRRKKGDDRSDKQSDQPEEEWVLVVEGVYP